jgi:hypothetical protein
MNLAAMTFTPNVRFLPSQVPFPSLRVVRAGGVDVPPNPTGSFIMPDVSVKSGSVTFAIEALNIPLNAIVDFEVRNETAGRVPRTFTQVLMGTPEASTGSVEFPDFPSGNSIVVVRARWSP